MYVLKTDIDDLYPLLFDQQLMDFLSIATKYHFIYIKLFIKTSDTNAKQLNKTSDTNAMQLNITK